MKINLKRHTNEDVTTTKKNTKGDGSDGESREAKHERNLENENYEKLVHQNDNVVQDDEEEEDDTILYVVSIDSRGRSTSDLDCYKECTCSNSFFEEHISGRTQNHVCVTSQVAGLCGLNLHMYYYDHIADDSNIMFASGSEIERENNTIATLLTFDPDTGHTKHKVYGKAYVTWDNGKSPLSKRQLWGIVELIREARIVYQTRTTDPVENHQHYSAKLGLLKWTSQYQTGNWVPRSIYEPRNMHKRRTGHKHHHPHLAIPHKHHHRHLDRELSGISDQATCHHGSKGHVHHEGHHECCHHHHHRHKDGHVSDSDSSADESHLDRTHVVVEDKPHNDRKLDIELFLEV